nr:hypothetical protein [uncultured Cellulosilyticum sp.]
MKKKRYEVTWYKPEEAVLNEEIKDKLVSAMVEEAKALAVRLTCKRINEVEMVCELEAGACLNLNKVLRSLQKKVSKKIGYPLEKVFDMQKGVRIITFPNHLAKEDGRLNRLIKDIVDVGYYDLHEFFGGDLMAFKLCLAERRLGIIDLGERIFLVDQELLKHKINLNCFACTKKHQYGCCCGSPCNMSSRNKERFDKYEAEIAEEVKTLDPEGYKKIKQTGGFVFLDGSINACEGHCALLVAHEGSYKCMAHKYALEHDMSIYEICPLSCLMYPLEIMTLFTSKQKRITFLTSVVEETFATTYGRWGSYASLDVELRCINEKAHDEVFVLEDYKPVYEVNQGLLTYAFGKAVYEGIVYLCNENAGE